jgi:hypothetical protein
MVKIYLDDERIPIDKDWIVVKNYEEFVLAINRIGLSNISVISLDHDLGDEAIKEYNINVKKNFKLNYKNIPNEKTGLDCCKFLVNLVIDENQTLPQIYVHSANPVGRVNMMEYINNFLEFMGEARSCVYNPIPHKLQSN